jgi:hypothetical protein
VFVWRAREEFTATFHEHAYEDARLTPKIFLNSLKVTVFQQQQPILYAAHYAENNKITPHGLLNDRADLDHAE